MAIDSAVAPHQFRVVLAYNGKDHDSVVQIYEELKRRGLDPWIDSRNHRPGTDWRKGFTAALKEASAAIVFYGENGSGAWQEQEIPSIHQQCVDKNIHVIPVVLPNGELPDDMLFTTKTPVRFQTVLNDREALNNLEFGITDRNPRDRRGQYEILAPVNEVERSCFLAVSHATSREIYNVMLKAALDTGLIVTQPREHSPDADNVYTPNVVLAIRSSTVILVDGTPHPETKKPDADVMYEVGLAQAHAKPMIYISTPLDSALPLPIFAGDKMCKKIEYDANGDINVLGPLQEELAEALKETLKKIHPPHIVPDNDLGLRAVYSVVHQHRAEFLQPFEQIMHYGLSIKRVFTDILSHVHKMHQIISLVFTDVENCVPNPDLEKTLIQFRKVHQDFCQAHMGGIEIPELCKDAIEATKGFDELQEMLADADDHSVEPIIRKSRQFFEILESFLDQYLSAHEVLLNRIENPNPIPQRQVAHLHSNVKTLATRAEGVPAQASAMMFLLLELIGMRSEPGGIQ
ncbi:MAG: toll/interleukin-1 receptor domain-containing protein [Planctomycetota bacterium]